MTGENETVKIEKRGDVAIVTLLRSARRNAMDQALVDGVKAAFLKLDRDDDIGAIVLAGAAPGFSAGSDLKFIGALDLDAMGRFEQECGDLGRLIGYLSKPVVAAVEMFAVGGGFAGALTGFLLAGIGIGLAETAESSVVALNIPREVRGHAFGVLGLTQSVGDIGATVVAGLLWSIFSPTVAFAYAATWMLLSVIVLRVVGAPASRDPASR